MGRGERGAFKVQPYKDELPPDWTVKSLDAAEESAGTIFERLRQYERDGDFVEMDWPASTSRWGTPGRCATPSTPAGRSTEDSEAQRTSDASGETASREEGEPQEWDGEEKREIALVFEEKWERVREDEEYQQVKEEHRERYE